MTKIKKILAATSALAIVLSLTGCLRESEDNYVVSLEAWGVIDDSDAYREIIGRYGEINKHATVDYKKFSVESYKQELLEALASGTGPDIFMINNTWLPAFKDAIVPTSESIITFQSFKDSFVDTVIQDFTDGGKIYGAPLSVDSLSLFYNKDLLNEAGITSPPKTWQEFNDAVKRLTKIDNYGNITQAGAAIGTAYNINRSTDILGTLMLQNGAKMVNDNKNQAAFNEGVATTGGSVANPGINALEFYTQFANSSSSVYTWNRPTHYSIDAFYEGKLAMMFNYSWHVATIKSKAPRINFDIAEMPQLENGNKTTFSNYWGWVVAKNKRTIAADRTNKKAVPITDDLRWKEAWNFIKFMTMDTAVTEKYLEKTGKPAARRDIIEKQKTDPVLGVFVKQNLIARNWYQVDPENTERVFAEVIDEVNRGGMTPRDAIELAAQRVSNFMRK